MYLNVHYNMLHWDRAVAAKSGNFGKGQQNRSAMTNIPKSQENAYQKLIRYSCSPEVPLFDTATVILSRIKTPFGGSGEGACAPYLLFHRSRTSTARVK